MRNAVSIRIYEDYYDAAHECTIVKRLSNFLKLTKSSVHVCEYACVYDAKNAQYCIESVDKSTHKNILGAYNQFESLLVNDKLKQPNASQCVDVRIEIDLQFDKKHMIFDSIVVLKNLLLSLSHEYVRFGAVVVEKSAIRPLSKTSIKQTQAKSATKKIMFEMLITAPSIELIDKLETSTLYNQIVECLNKHLLFKLKLAIASTSTNNISAIRCGKFVLNNTLQCEHLTNPTLHIENFISVVQGHFIATETLDEIVKKLLFNSFDIEYKIGGDDLKEIITEFKTDPIFNLHDIVNNFRNKMNILEFFKFLRFKSEALKKENYISSTQELNTSSSTYYNVLRFQLLEYDQKQSYAFLESILKALFKNCKQAVHLGVLIKSTNELYVVYTTRRRWFYNEFAEITDKNALFDLRSENIANCQAYVVLASLYKNDYEIAKPSSEFVDQIQIFDQIHSKLILDAAVTADIDSYAADIGTYQYSSDEDLVEALKPLDSKIEKLQLKAKEDTSWLRANSKFKDFGDDVDNRIDEFFGTSIEEEPQSQIEAESCYFKSLDVAARQATQMFGAHIDQSIFSEFLKSAALLNQQLQVQHYQNSLVTESLVHQLQQLTSSYEVMKQTNSLLESELDKLKQERFSLQSQVQQLQQQLQSASAIVCMFAAGTLYRGNSDIFRSEFLQIICDRKSNQFFSQEKFTDHINLCNDPQFVQRLIAKAYVQNFSELAQYYVKHYEQLKQQFSINNKNMQSVDQQDQQIND